jgi:hypothetical protein
MRTDEKFSSAVEPLRRQVERWRSTRGHRERMPEALWQSAAEVARRHGINPVARALHLDYYRLQGRVKPRMRQQGNQAAAGGFVEVQLPTSSQNWECTVELEDRRGAKMKLHLVGGGVAELGALVQSFWSRQP